MGSSWPLQSAQPFGAKPKLMIRISERNGSAIFHSLFYGGNTTPQLPTPLICPPPIVMNVGSGVGVVVVFTPGGVVPPLDPMKFAIPPGLSLNAALIPTRFTPELAAPNVCTTTLV